MEVLHEGMVMQCCGQPMTLLKENTTDGAREKHVPVVEPVEGGYRVVVGSSEHPMLAEHFIEWIELACLSQGTQAGREARGCVPHRRQTGVCAGLLQPARTLEKLNLKSSFVPPDPVHPCPASTLWSGGFSVCRGARAD